MKICGEFYIVWSKWRTDRQPESSFEEVRKTHQSTFTGRTWRKWTVSEFPLDSPCSLPTLQRRRGWRQRKINLARVLIMLNGTFYTFTRTILDSWILWRHTQEPRLPRSHYSSIHPQPRRFNDREVTPVGEDLFELLGLCYVFFIWTHFAGSLFSVSDSLTQTLVVWVAGGEFKQPLWYDKNVLVCTRELSLRVDLLTYLDWFWLPPCAFWGLFPGDFSHTYKIIINILCQFVRRNIIGGSSSSQAVSHSDCELEE